jgi:hypothetical protein
MWTAKNRPRYNRDKLRYPSDLSEEEWALVEPQIPPGKRSTASITSSTSSAATKPNAKQVRQPALSIARA